MKVREQSGDSKADNFVIEVYRKGDSRKASHKLGHSIYIDCLGFQLLSSILSGNLSIGIWVYSCRRKLCLWSFFFLFYSIRHINWNDCSTLKNCARRSTELPNHWDVFTSLELVDIIETAVLISYVLSSMASFLRRTAFFLRIYYLFLSSSCFDRSLWPVAGEFIARLVRISYLISKVIFFTHLIHRFIYIFFFLDKRI